MRTGRVPIPARTVSLMSNYGFYRKWYGFRITISLFHWFFLALESIDKIFEHAEHISGQTVMENLGT